MEQKSLLKNSMYNMLYKGLNIVFPLITVTYVSRILMASGVGQVSYAQNIAQYFVTLAALGIPNYGIREIAKCRDDEIERNRTFSELFYINLCSTVIVTFMYYGMIIIFPGFSKNYMLHMVVGLSICLNAINVDWFYQGIEEYRYIAARSFAIKIISLALIFILIRDSKDTINYAAINCFGVGGNYILNIVHLKKHGLKLYANNINMVKHMKSIFVLLASVISVELYTLLDTTMVGVICGEEQVGYYSNSMKLIKLLITLVTAIGGVLLPRLSYHHMRGEEDKCSEIVSQVFQIMLFVFLPCQIGIFMISDQIIEVLFGNSFKAAGITLKIASFLITTLGFSNLFGTQVLLTYKKEKLMLVTTICGAVTNVIINAVLIPRYAQNGAALASVFSETMVTVMSVLFALRFIKITVSKKYLFSLFLSSTLLICILLIVKTFFESNAMVLCSSVMLGGIVYIGCNIVLKNPILKNLFKDIRAKKI